MAREGQQIPKFKIKKFKLCRGTTLISIYRNKSDHDLIPVLYDILHKIDLSGNRRKINKIKKSYDIDNDLAEFMEHLVIKINKDFKNQNNFERTEEGDLVLNSEPGSYLYEHINCDYIRESLHEFYSKKG